MMTKGIREKEKYSILLFESDFTFCKRMTLLLIFVAIVDVWFFIQIGSAQASSQFHKGGEKYKYLVHFL